MKAPFTRFLRARQRYNGVGLDVAALAFLAVLTGVLVLFWWLVSALLAILGMLTHLQYLAGLLILAWLYCAWAKRHPPTSRKR